LLLQTSNFKLQTSNFKLQTSNLLLAKILAQREGRLRTKGKGKDRKGDGGIIIL